jgi:hypothetical protein
METAQLSDADRATLTALEEELWREETRFDRKRMTEVIAPDFVEFGRSGRTYDRETCLAFERKPIDAVLPLPNFNIRLISPDVALVTYDSAVTYSGVVQHAHRSSLWSRSEHGWQLRFHQGTPYETKA